MSEVPCDRTELGEAKSFVSIIHEAFQVAFGRLLITFLLLITTWGTLTYAY